MLEQHLLSTEQTRLLRARACHVQWECKQMSVKHVFTV